MPGRFPVDVRDEAAGAARRLATPDSDLTDLPFVTIDPQDSMDLDQAMHLSRDGEGFLVRYAIADVAAEYAPRDGSAAAAGRPVRVGGVRVDLGGCRRAGLGSGGAAGPARGHGGLRTAGRRLRGRVRRRGRGRCHDRPEGDVFPGVVVDVATGDDRGEVVIQEPAVRGRIDGDDLPLGEDVSVRLVEAAIEARRVAFALA